MKRLEHLFKQNQEWAENIKADNPDFFTNLAAQQTPEYLWIGCSDSRVPANQLTGLLPGDIFVHRNVANLVVHTDVNSLSVLQYAVDVLQVKHVIVCGHYGCGGILAAMRGETSGLIDNWLLNVQDVYDKYQSQVDAIEDDGARADYMCEINVAEQVTNLCKTSIIRDAWGRGQQVAVHGWIYSISDGLLRDLDLCIEKSTEVAGIHQTACDLAKPYLNK
ncbi:carbonate dehydratase [Endozoicomonadaceae bacterium StTr2]